MALVDRIAHACIGVVVGALIGVVFWWLYGAVYSLRFLGPGIDPVLRHWVVYASSAFGVVGFIFRERLGDAIGDAVSLLFHVESGERPARPIGALAGLVFLVIIVSAIWFSVPVSS